MDEVLCDSKKVFSTWAGIASHCIGDCFDLAKPFLDKNNSFIHPYVRFVISQLYIDCHLTSESILILIREGKEWDADVLVRPVMEGSLKFVYMVLGDADAVKEKAQEFWETLPSFSDIKHSDRAKRILEDVTDQNEPKYYPFQDLVLDEIAIEKINQSHTRNQRKKMAERWSFTGICRSFVHSGDEGLKQLEHLAHGYGMSSHLVHKDGVGVGMVWDRSQRDPRHLTAVKLGHSARIVSDVCELSRLRLLQLLKAFGKSINPIYDIEKRYSSFFGELSKAISNFTKIEYEK